MGRPGILCQLEKEKMIDCQTGFVDTFNWVTKFADNLRGDDENIKVENPTGDNPVIRWIGEDASGGGSIEVKCIDGEGNETTATCYGTLTLKSGANSNVSFSVTGSDGDVEVTVDVYYK